MKSMAWQATPTPVLDLLPSLLTTKTNRPPITERLQIHVHLLDGAPLLAGSASFRLEPAGELQGKGVELGRAGPLGIVRLGLACAQVLADGVAREARAAGDLSDGQLLSQGPAPDDTQCCHVYHSWSPAAQ